jgi:PAS domain-containing protein
LPPEKYPMAIAIKEHRLVYGEEVIVQRPDGSLMHVNPYSSPLFNTRGQLSGAVNLLMGAAKKGEKEKENEEKYRKTIEQASDAILIYSLDGTIHEFNNSCCTLPGYSREEYAKLRLNDILIGDIIPGQQIMPRYLQVML